MTATGHFQGLVNTRQASDTKLAFFFKLPRTRMNFRRNFILSRSGARTRKFGGDIRGNRAACVWKF